METYSTSNFIADTFLTLGSLLIIVPLGGYLVFSGFKMILFEVGLISSYTYKLRGFGKTAVGVFVNGWLCLAIAVWYLFFESGGNLSPYLNQLSKLFWV